MFGRWASRAGVCYAVTAIVVAALLYPLTYEPRQDSFPLSNFPMFAGRRPKATLVQYFMIAGGAGFRMPITPGVIGSTEVLQAQATIRNAVKRGRPRVRQLCERVAAEVARRDKYDRALRVQVVKGRYDAIDYLTGADTTGAERVVYQCKVPR